MSVSPQDPGGETGPGQERPPITSPIPDETQRPDIVAPQHDPQPLEPDDEPGRDRDPDSSGDESEDQPARA